MGIALELGADERRCSTVLQYDLIVPPGFTREPPLFVHSCVHALQVSLNSPMPISNLLKTLNGVGLVGPGSLFTHVVSVLCDMRSSSVTFLL